MINNIDRIQEPVGVSQDPVLLTIKTCEPSRERQRETPEQNGQIRMLLSGLFRLESEQQFSVIWGVYLARPGSSGCQCSERSLRLSFHAFKPHRPLFTLSCPPSHHCLCAGMSLPQQAQPGSSFCCTEDYTTYTVGVKRKQEASAVHKTPCSFSPSLLEAERHRSLLPSNIPLKPHLGTGTLCGDGESAPYSALTGHSPSSGSEPSPLAVSPGTGGGEEGGGTSPRTRQFPLPGWTPGLLGCNK